MKKQIILVFFLVLCLLTVSQGHYTSKQAMQLHVKSYVLSNDKLEIMVSVKNTGDTTLKDTHISVSIPGYAQYLTETIRRIKSRRSEHILFEIDIPKNHNQYEYLKVSAVSENYRRVKYREIYLP